MKYSKKLDYLQELKYGRQKLDDEIIYYFNSLPDELEKARKIIKTARKFTISKSRVYTAIKFKKISYENNRRSSKRYEYK
jgi:hypothetical protein